MEKPAQISRVRPPRFDSALNEWDNWGKSLEERFPFGFTGDEVLDTCPDFNKALERADGMLGCEEQCKECGVTVKIASSSGNLIVHGDCPKK